MNAKELDNLYWEVQEAEWLKEKIEELDVEKITTHLTGMPRGYEVSKKTQNMAVMMVSLKSQLERQYERCMENILRITEYIGTIKDPEIRSLFRLRFIECRTYQDIAKIKNYADHTVVWKKINYYLEGKPKSQKQYRSQIK